MLKIFIGLTLYKISINDYMCVFVRLIFVAAVDYKNIVCTCTACLQTLGWTALHYAAVKGREDIAELLVNPVLQTDILLVDNVSQ